MVCCQPDRIHADTPSPYTSSAYACGLSVALGGNPGTEDCYREMNPAEDPAKRRRAGRQSDQSTGGVLQCDL